MTNIPLMGDEKLVAGDVVGIDAEFVSLNQVSTALELLFCRGVNISDSLVSPLRCGGNISRSEIDIF